MRTRRNASIAAGVAASAVAAGLVGRALVRRRHEHRVAVESAWELPPEDLGLVRSFDGTGIAVRAAGDPEAPVILFVHGFSLDMTTWLEQWRDLSIDFVLMKDLYPKQLEIAQAVAAMLADVGVKLNIRNLEIATAREARTAGTYDMFFSGWAHLPHDPDWYLGQWFTKAGAEKLTRFNDPRVEQLVAEGRVPDPKVRQQKYEELQRILWEDEPEIWPYYSVAIYAVSDRLRNFEARRDYYILLSDVGIA